LKWTMSSLGNKVSNLTWKIACATCGKLKDSSGLQPSVDQQEYIIANLNPYLYTAINSSAAGALRVNPENVAAIATMMNQCGRARVSFSGGEAAQYSIAAPSSDLTVGVLRVVNGICTYGPKTATVLAECGAVGVVAVIPTVVNLVNVALTVGAWNVESDYETVKTLPQGTKIDGFIDGHVITPIVPFLRQVIKVKKIGRPATINKLCLNSFQIQKALDNFKPGQLGLTGEQAFKFSGCDGRDTLSKIDLKRLEVWLLRMKTSFGQRAKAFKESDTGWSAINAPLKWVLPLELFSGPRGFLNDDKLFKKFPEFKADLTISYWGAAGNRARRVFDNRFLVEAFDVQAPQLSNNRVPDSLFEKYKIGVWKQSDIMSVKSIETNVFASDIYFDDWKNSVALDPNGCRFVSGILAGKIVSGDNVTCEKLPPIRLVKGFIPSASQIVNFKQSLPFIIARTCRPSSEEIIFIKSPLTIDEMAEKLKLLEKAYGSDFSDRFYFCSDLNSFEAACLKIKRAVVVEWDFQIRRLVVDPHFIFCSKNNRNWWLAHWDMPCVYVPPRFKQFTGLQKAEKHAVDYAANVYEDLAHYDTDEYLVDEPALPVNLVAAPVNVNPLIAAMVPMVFDNQ